MSKFTKENKSSSALIAVAPELLEFIKELVTQPGQLHEDVMKMRSLIAKAEGSEDE